MHFIDHLPLPVYIIILIISIIIMIKYALMDKNLNLGEKIGFLLCALGGSSLILIKLVKETPLQFKYYNFLWVFVVTGLGIGFIFLLGGNYKRVNDPEQKRKILIGLVFWVVSIILCGLFALYLWR